MTGIDRDALAVQISESGNPRRRDYAAADRVIAHLEATGPRDAGLRERVAMALMAVEHVGKVDLKHHPLEWHWTQRFNDEDRDEYRALADAAIEQVDAALATPDESAPDSPLRPAQRSQDPGPDQRDDCHCDRTTARLVVCPVHPERHDAVLAAIEARRAEPGFMARVQASIERHKPTLDRLAEDDDPAPAREAEGEQR